MKICYIIRYINYQEYHVVKYIKKFNLELVLFIEYYYFIFDRFIENFKVYF